MLINNTLDEPLQRGEPLHDKIKVYAGERNIFCFKAFQANIDVVLLDYF